MIIFSNDFHSNYLKKKVSSGGLARFAGDFSEYAINHKHTWKGIAFSTHDKRKTSVRKIKNSLKVFWEVKVDQNLIKAIGRTSKKINPEKVLRVIIEQVRLVIRKSSADIVFLNGFYIFNWIIMQAARLENKKIVVQHGGVWAKEINIYRDFFSVHGRKILLQMERDITDYASVEIFLNEYSKKIYNNLVRKVPARQSRVIPLPFSGKKVLVPKFKKFDSRKALKIGIIARWDRIKNHEAVLKLAKEIKKQQLPWKIYSVTNIPDTKAKLVLKNEYRKLIEVVAPMDYKYIIKFLQQMDLMILPSHFDVSPNVVLEAANEGLLTLISSNVGWVNEYRRNQCGNLITDFSKPRLVINKIKNFDVKGIAPKINRMFLNLNKKHDKIKIFKAYLQLFEKLTVKN